MPAQSIIERSFSGGELSPALYARTDQVKYSTGARTLRNMICMRNGGVTQRPGTMYIGNTLNGGNPVRLIPFIFNETGLGQSYVLEFGDQYIAFYQDGANSVSVNITQISSITQASPGVFTVPIDLTGFPLSAPYNIVAIDGIEGMTELNNRYFKMVDIVTGASSTFTLTDLDGNPIDTTLYTPFVSGGSISGILLVTSPYLQTDLATLQFAQSADILTIVHQEYQVYELVRNSPISWALTAQSLQNFGLNIGGVAAVGGGVGALTFTYYVSGIDKYGTETPKGYLNFSVLAGIAQPSPTNPIAVSWTADPLAVYYNIYLNDGTGYGYIGTTTDNFFSDPGITPDFSNVGPILNTIIGVGSGNYPATVGFVQQRRCFAATKNNPVGFWMSRTGIYNNFNTDLNPSDDSAIFASLASEEVNQIEHILELKFMLMLTAGAELFVQGNGSGVITPSAINASTQSQYGSSPLRPLKVGDVLIFNQALGSFIRDFVFNFAIDGYNGNDLTIFSSHLFEGYQIVDWAYQKTPDSIIWTVRNDGVLLSLTYIREQQILAWTRHDYINGFVENVISIPENGDYSVYVIVKRTIDGSTVRYLERISSRIWNDPIEATYLDSFLEYDGRNTGSTTMTITGDPNTTFVEEGVSDGIDFREPLLANVNLFAVVPSGSYTPLALAQAMATAMNKVAQQTFVGSVNVGRVELNANAGSGTYVLDFSPTAPHADRSIGAIAGFDPASYSIGGGIVIAHVQPFHGFATGPGAYQQLLLLQSSAAFFTSDMVGGQIFIEDDLFVSSKGKSGNQIRLSIQSYTDPTNVMVTPNRTVPISMQTIFTNWSHAIKNINGLWHLRGQQVSVYADRFLVGSPLNPNVTSHFTVSSTGTLALDKPRAVVYIGLPMILDFETLDIDTAFGESILDQPKAISRVIAYLYNSRTFFGGQNNPDLDPQNVVDGVVQDYLHGLYENKAEADRQNYDQPPTLMTDPAFVNIECNWAKGGRIFIRNVDPVPLSILAVIPAGLTAAKVPNSQRV